MSDLAGARVVVTGGSRGIGAACCRLFARAGATVLVHYRAARGEAESVLADCRGASDGDHDAFAADLAAPDALDALFDHVASRWGGLDCLVNNAGVWEPNPLAELDRHRLEWSWQVNVRAAVLCAARALPLLAGSSRASIVNLSSTAGQRGEAGYGPYAAAKGALISLTKSWAVELAPVVRVNAVAPGWVDTEMSAPAYRAGGREAIEKAIPLGRVASAEDIAAPVVFLASPAARHVTGEVLNVNGGAVLCG